MQTIDYRRGLPAMAACFLIWGFQPLYWYMCTNVCGEIDTFFLMACRIIWAAVTCLCILKVQGKLPQLWAVFKDKQVLKRELPASVFLFGDWIVYLWALLHPAAGGVRAGRGHLQGEDELAAFYHHRYRGGGHRALRLRLRRRALCDHRAGADVRRLRGHQEEPDHRFHRVHHVGDTDDGARGAAFHPFLPHGR